ncbi:MAG: potassium transporter TrkA, partial [Desulfurococcus sp.]
MVSSGNLTPEQHRRLHEKFTRIRYKPVSVASILKTIWSLSDIGLDLAFYAYFSRDTEAAERVLDINRVIDENLAQFIMHTALAYGRTREGAEASLLAFYYGSAIDTIVDSVKDIVYTLLVGHAPSLSYDEIALLMDGEIVAKLVLEKPVKIIELTDAYP